MISLLLLLYVIKSRCPVRQHEFTNRERGEVARLTGKNVSRDRKVSDFAQDENLKKKGKRFNCLREVKEQLPSLMGKTKHSTCYKPAACGSNIITKILDQQKKMKKKTRKAWPL